MALQSIQWAYTDLDYVDEIARLIALACSAMVHNVALTAVDGAQATPQKIAANRTVSARAKHGGQVGWADRRTKRTSSWRSLGSFCGASRNQASRAEMPRGRV